MTERGKTDGVDFTWLCFISPTDRQRVFCFDLLTGRPKWKNDETSLTGIPREDSLFVGCVDSDAVLLVGTDRIRAVDVESGKTKWATPTQDYGKPSGYGFATRSHYFAPTTTRNILKVDLATGSIDAVVTSSEILGNLVNFATMLSRIVLVASVYSAK